MRPRGFSLMELVVVLAIISVLTVQGFYAIQVANRVRAQRAHDDVFALARGVWGGGPEEDNGYLGDMGGLPIALSAVHQPTLPVALRQNYRGETFGWWGPYAGFGGRALTLDPWHRPWNYDATTPGSQGLVSSRGGDGVVGSIVPGRPSDDLFEPRALPRSPVGSLMVTVRDPRGRRLKNNTAVILVERAVEVAVMRRTGGGVSWDTANAKPTDETFRFDALAQGRYPIQAAGLAGSELAGWAGFGVAWVGGGALSSIEIVMQGAYGP